MIESAIFIHYLTIVVTITLPAICVGIGEGLIGMSALSAMNKQPQAHNDILRTAFLGTAIVETTAILGLFISIVLLLSGQNTTFDSPYPYISELGILFAVGITGCVSGILSAIPAQHACNTIARQPFFAQKTIGFTIMTQALIQSPIIAGFIVGFLIKSQMFEAQSYADALRLIAGGLCIGLGSIGPSFGLAYFAKTANKALGYNKRAYPQLLPFTLVSQALIETPIIFALIISLLIILMVPTLQDHDMLRGIAMISASLATGIGTFGPGISSGTIAATTCTQIAENPESYGTLSRASMLGQALVETCILYGILISIALIFFS